MEITLPAAIKSQAILTLIAQMHQAGQEPRIILNFQFVRQVTPAALALITAVVLRWRREKREVHFKGVIECSIMGYLQRMDFFKLCGMDLDESFERHSSSGRFVPVQFVDYSVDALGEQVAECLAPGGGEYDSEMADLYSLAWYVITETANNVRQHSKGVGYLCAQITRKDGLLRFAIADNGKGILNSFREAERDWHDETSDTDAILHALKPRVSSKAGNGNNEGVGLTLVHQLARLTDGWIAVISGTGLVRVSGNGDPIADTLPDNGCYRGTLVALALRESNVKEYASLLNQAKIEAGLLHKDQPRANFT